MLRILHLLSVVCLVVAAVAVYKLKYEASYEAQQVAKLRNEIRLERERLATLRAEWALLSTPQRIQSLTERHLGLKPLAVSQVSDLSDLPEKPFGFGDSDPIGEFIGALPDTEQRSDPLGEFLRSLNGENGAAPRSTREGE